MKPLNEYIKNEFGVEKYIGDEGEEYDSLEEFLQIYALKFCGCGLPKENLEFIYAVLEKITHYHDEILPSLRKEDDQLRREYYLKKDEDWKSFFMMHWEKALWFFCYVMDEKRIMTHGGSALNGWVDDENFMQALKQFIKNNKENNDDQQ